MAACNASPNPAGLPMEREVVITRVFDAPRELVFRAWTDPKHMAMDVRAGGAWRIVMPERLVFTNDAADKDGNVIIEGFTTVTFDDQNGKTKLTLQTRGVAKVDYAANYLKGMETGWTQSLDRLGESLGSLPIRNSSSRASSMRPAIWCGKPSPSLNVSRTGGGRRASRCWSATWISAPVEYSATPCDLRMAMRRGVNGCIVKSFRRSA
jgi:uncharacterized protein YndB with AHSA1/START domain